MGMIGLLAVLSILFTKQSRMTKRGCRMAPTVSMMGVAESARSMSLGAGMAYQMNVGIIVARNRSIAHRSNPSWYFLVAMKGRL